MTTYSIDVPDRLVRLARAIWTGLLSLMWGTMFVVAFAFVGTGTAADERQKAFDRGEWWVGLFWTLEIAYALFLVVYLGYLYVDHSRRNAEERKRKEALDGQG